MKVASLIGDVWTRKKRPTIYARMERNARRIKVLFVGPKSGGKSAFLRRLSRNEFRENKYAAGEESPKAAEKLRLESTLETGAVFQTDVWDCPSDVFDRADDGVLRTLFGGARAVVYFISDADFKMIDGLKDCAQKSQRWISSVGEEKCAQMVILNHRLHQNTETFVQLSKNQANALRALHRTVDVKQNEGVTEAWAELLGFVNFQSIAPETHFSSPAAAIVQPTGGCFCLLI